MVGGVPVVPSTPFQEVAVQRAEHDVGGLPVLDEGDRVVGVVPATDPPVRRANGAGGHGPVRGQGGLHEPDAPCRWGRGTAGAASAERPPAV